MKPVLDDAGTALSAAATLLTALTGLVSAAVAAVITLRRRGRAESDPAAIDAPRKSRPPKNVDVDQVMALAIEAEVKRRQAVAELEALRAQQARQREMGETR